MQGLGFGAGVLKNESRVLGYNMAYLCRDFSACFVVIWEFPKTGDSTLNSRILNIRTPE